VYLIANDVLFLDRHSLNANNGSGSAKIKHGKIITLVSPQNTENTNAKQNCPDNPSNFSFSSSCAI
jgi:hypothetical protein